MAPNVIEPSTAEGRRASTVLQLNNLKRAIPEEAFEKVLWKSTAYMLFDITVWCACVYGMVTLCNSSYWENMALWQKIAASLVYFSFTGFYMWVLFMVGHDAGHSTFSNYEIVNDFVGHIAHGALLVPYYPWQLSHRRHHMYHNHADKDYSHPWYTPDRLAQPDEGLARFVHSNPLLSGLFPFFGWAVYLYGMPDGSHFIPHAEQRLWKDTPKIERFKCIFSTSVVIAFLTAFYFAAGQNLSALGFYYFGPFLVFNWWLVTVTYLQHHNHDTLVYDDKDWKFVDAAFETIDRKFGFGIDTLHHHITDGHVAHHLFFTKIPHYNLPVATKAIREYLEKNELGWLYKEDKTYDFPYRVHSYMMKFGLRAKRAAVVGGRSPADIAARDRAAATGARAGGVKNE